MIAPDLHRCGHIDQPADGLDVAAAADIATLVDKLDITGVHVVGHDWGIVHMIMETAAYTVHLTVPALWEQLSVAGVSNACRSHDGKARR